MTDTTAKQAEWCAAHIKEEVHYVLEAGLDSGTSAIYWLKRFPKAQITSIDNNPNAVGVKRIAVLPENKRFTFLVGDSPVVIDNLQLAVPFDFIYIDTAHDRLTTFRELVSSWGKLRWGGWLTGHDYLLRGESCRSDWPSDVMSAVDNFCKYMNLDYETDAVDDPTTGCFAIQKVYNAAKDKVGPKTYSFVRG